MIFLKIMHKSVCLHRPILGHRNSSQASIRRLSYPFHSQQSALLQYNKKIGKTSVKTFYKKIQTMVHMIQIILAIWIVVDTAFV